MQTTHETPSSPCQHGLDFEAMPTETFLEFCESDTLSFCALTEAEARAFMGRYLIEKMAFISQCVDRLRSKYAGSVKDPAFDKEDLVSICILRLLKVSPKEYSGTRIRYKNAKVCLFDSWVQSVCQNALRDFFKRFRHKDRDRVVPISSLTGANGEPLSLNGDFLPRGARLVGIQHSLTPEEEVLWKDFLDQVLLYIERTWDKSHRLIFKEYLIQGKTQEEVGRPRGFSQSEVSNLIGKICPGLEAELRTWGVDLYEVWPKLRPKGSKVKR